MQQSSPLDPLFFGSSSKTCNLTLLPVSQFFTYNSSSILNLRDNYTVQLGLHYKSPFSYLGLAYSHLYLPCPPANELFFQNYQTSFQKSYGGYLQTSQAKQPSNTQLSANKINDQISEFPDQSPQQPQQSSQTTSKPFLQNILIKTADNFGPSVTYTGFASGKRSAVVYWPSDNKYYRLKGCGNLTEGFPLETLTSSDKSAVEIRGCQFLHTSMREQYMSDYVNTLLAPSGIILGNVPLGIWKYEHFSKDCELKLKDEGVLIDKYCGVFETRGEKRLATHLLQGLEVILHFMVYVQQSSQNQTYETIINQIANALPKDRVERNKETSTVESLDPSSWAAQIIDIPENMTLHELALKPLYSDEVNNRLFNMYSNLTSGSATDPFNYSNIYDALPTMPALSDKSSDLKATFTSIVDQFRSNNVGLLTLTARLFARLGWEAGRVTRILQDNDVNWGYYADHEPYTFHCNAHPNNFIVLSPGLSKNLLAPLDFDISLLRQNYISLTDDKGYGTLDNKEFDVFLNCERHAMESALGGMENMANFQYKTIDMQKLSNEGKVAFDCIRTGLRDTIMLYYRFAYDKKSNIEMEGFDAGKEGDIGSLIKLALIISDGAMC